ncbi:unnamed protein product [Rotaria sordida]|uniref:Uncharacterized protein n=1 Tax=Rotaria sordida TaxID=392033 RepID=A0A819SC14_9BILA|nr:unnamed protein product [Rotaria sordida]CAF4060526.1 unnamed protein product [Rotaria sordida]
MIYQYSSTTSQATIKAPDPNNVVEFPFLHNDHQRQQDYLHSEIIEEIIQNKIIESESENDKVIQDLSDKNKASQQVADTEKPKKQHSDATASPNETSTKPPKSTNDISTKLQSTTNTTSAKSSHKPKTITKTIMRNRSQNYSIDPNLYSITYDD